MSILPLLAIGFIAVIIACFVHGQTDTMMPRSKFVTLALYGVGSMSLGYVALWVIAGQRPLDFSLTPFAVFGLTLWVTAAVYSTIFTLLQKDTAPSR